MESFIKTLVFWNMGKLVVSWLVFVAKWVFTFRDETHCSLSGICLQIRREKSIAQKECKFEWVACVDTDKTDYMVLHKLYIESLLQKCLFCRDAIRIYVTVHSFWLHWLCTNAWNSGAAIGRTLKWLSVQKHFCKINIGGPHSTFHCSCEAIWRRLPSGGYISCYNHPRG